MNTEEKIKLTEKALLDACRYALPTNEYVSGIGCADRGVECDCFCREARIIEAMIVAGYRRADEVRKETAKEILQDLYDEASKYCDDTMGLNTYEIKQLAKKYGVEVDE